MLKQSGFLSGLTLQLVAGVGAVALVVGLYAYINGLRDSLQACERTNLVLNQELATQNAAVAKLENASREAQKRAGEALRRSQSHKQALDKELTRLKASKGSSCGEAVEQVRKGLTK